MNGYKRRKLYLYRKYGLTEVIFTPRQGEHWSFLLIVPGKKTQSAYPNLKKKKTFHANVHYVGN